MANDYYMPDPDEERSDEEYAMFLQDLHMAELALQEQQLSDVHRKELKEVSA